MMSLIQSIYTYLRLNQNKISFVSTINPNKNIFSYFFLTNTHNVLNPINSTRVDQIEFN